MQNERENNGPSAIFERRHGYLFHACVFLLLAFAAFLIYSKTFSFPFSFDDNIYIVRNEVLWDIGNLWPPEGSRYLTYLSFALNYRFGGLEVFGYHAVNLALHIANGWLVYLLVLLVLKSSRVRGAAVGPEKGGARMIALAVAALFVVHPVQTGAVTYITQRFASLASFFYLASIVLYLGWRLCSPGVKRPAFYLLSLVFAVCAMMTKEISFTLPAVIVLFEFTFFGAGEAGKKLLRLVPFLLTMLIIPLAFAASARSVADNIGAGIMHMQLDELSGISRYEYLITEFRVIVKYLRLLAFPAGQNLLYDYPLRHSLLEPGVFFSFLFLLGVVVFAVYLFVRSIRTGNAYLTLVSTGVFWFFITLSVESSIVPIRDAVFEHRLYLPSFGAFLALASAVSYFFERIKCTRPARAAAIALLLAALPLGAASYMRNNVWKDIYTLWSDVVKKSPHSALAHSNLGSAMHTRGDRQGGMKEFITAVGLDPGYTVARHNLANIYQELGMHEQAIREFREAVRQRPGNAEMYYNLGLEYMAAGKPGEAVKEYEAALGLVPGYIEVYYALGEAYNALGDRKAAARSFEIFIDGAPDKYADFKRSAALKLRTLEGGGVR